MRTAIEQCLRPMHSNVIDTEYAIFGLGKTGVSCARFLARKGEKITLLDTRETPPGIDVLRDTLPTSQVFLGRALPEDFGNCRCLILSPGIPRAHPFVEHALARGVEVIGDVELFARHVKRNVPVVAVTGSNGKSTVVTMVTNIVQAAGKRPLCGGNIGTPALDLLAQTEPDCYVIELSSFQLESTQSLSPRVACILNISADHMDRYDGFAAYAEAKKRIYMKAENVVLSADDNVLRTLKPTCNVVYISTTDQRRASYRIANDIDGERSLVANDIDMMSLSDLQVHGEHNYFNALAALAITDCLSIEPGAQRRALSRFKGLAHRCQTIANIGGVEWVDDSKGTNVGASCAAVDGVFADRSGVLIAGGQAKGADFRPFAEIVESKAHTVVLIGEDAQILAQALTGNVQIVFALDMQAAVIAASKAVQPTEAVLLSPACASLDMFENFEARGSAFAAAVKMLSDQST